MLSAFFAVVIGAFGISQFGQNAEYFASAQAAAYSIYEVIDREPTIDIASTEGQKFENLEGNIEFCDVDFTYPARTEQQILFSVSFKALAGQTVALCGQSGCGKSTCFQLLQRFYDAAKGSVKIDGVDIKNLNLKWLRENIGTSSLDTIKLIFRSVY